MTKLFYFDLPTKCLNLTTTDSKYVLMVSYSTMVYIYKQRMVCWVFTACCQVRPNNEFDSWASWAKLIDNSQCCEISNLSSVPTYLTRVVWTSFFGAEFTVRFCRVKWVTLVVVSQKLRVTVVMPDKKNNGDEKYHWLIYERTIRRPLLGCYR